MPDIDVYMIEDEEEFVPCTVEKYDIHLENYVDECFKDLKGLPLGLSKKVLGILVYIWDIKCFNIGLFSVQNIAFE